MELSLIVVCYIGAMHFFTEKKTQKIDQELASLKFNFSYEMEQVK